MRINKAQLKKLVEAVIREAEDAIAEPEQPITDPSPETMKYSRGHEKEYGDLEIKLTMKGGQNKSSYIIKDFIRQAAHAAKMKDLELIHAEIDKGGRKVADIDATDIHGANVAAYKASGIKVKDEPSSATTGEKAQEKKKEVLSVKQIVNAIKKETDPTKKKDHIEGLDPDEIRAVMRRLEEPDRLALIEPGEKKAEWDALTAKDEEEARRRKAKRSSLEKAGQLEMVPIDPKNPESPKLPKDTDLWTDKEWDLYTQGGETQAATAGAGTKHAGKSVYRPSFSAGKVDPALLKKLAIGTLREILQKKSRH